MRRQACVVGAIVAAACATSWGQSTQPATGRGLKPASKYLLLDTRLIDRTVNAHLTLGQVVKDGHNPLLAEEKPWEPRFDNLYANVLFDEQEKVYKCWYSPFIIDEAVTRTPPEKRNTLSYMDALHGNDRHMGVCYAVSADGVKWTRPELGIVDFNGTVANNIVLRGVHGAGVFKDPRDRDPQRRYKMLTKTGEDREPIGVAFSPDGLHWSRPMPCPQMHAAGDTHNNAFWDESIDRYVAITRLSDGRQRMVGRSVSLDFISWEEAVVVFHGTRERQTYAMPVFRFADVYLGLVMILDTHTDVVDSELAWSPDGVRWERVCEGTPLIPRGPSGSFDDGCVYAAAYPVVREDGILLYYGGSDDTHGSWRKGGLGLARLRPDGFAGMVPIDKNAVGEVLLRPVPCTGRQLRISADAVAGSLEVQVVDSAGIVLGTSRPVAADVSDGLVQWSDQHFLAKMQGKDIRLTFRLRSACVYSFRFSDR